MTRTTTPRQTPTLSPATCAGPQEVLLLAVSEFPDSVLGSSVVEPVVPVVSPLVLPEPLVVLLVPYT